MIVFNSCESTVPIGHAVQDSCASIWCDCMMDIIVEGED